ncbi:hypothetical protein D3C72_1296720 [compost metagenome]
MSTNCANNPTPIATAPFARCWGCRKSTRPPYSPILLGVKIAQVSPQKTDWKAFQNDICSSLDARYRHFTTSSNQLTSIKTTIKIRVQTTECCSKPAIRVLNFSILLLSDTFTTIYQVARAKTNIFNKRLMYFFCLPVNF